MRSPSGGAPGSTRGIAPVAIKMASALISASPAFTTPGPAKRPLALITLTPSAASRAVMSADWARARSVIRSYSRAALTVARPPVAMPSPEDRLSRVIALDVSMSVLEGTQSVRTHAPPSPSESTTVTSAPSCAATRAASYPPGPPPRIAIVCRSKVTINSPWSGLEQNRRAEAGRRTLAPVALYAAYGSNMDPEQMLLRCPHSPQRGTGWLEGWRLTFGGEDIGWDGALATVVEDPGSRVFVVVYDMFETDEKELDNWDGVTLGYYRKAKVRVQTLDGDVLAWLYVLNFYEGGLPSARAIGILADSAEKAGAPEDYVATLRALPCAKMGDANTGPYESEPPWT